MEAIEAAKTTFPVNMYDINKVSNVPIILQLIALAILRIGFSDFFIRSIIALVGFLI